MKMRLRVGISPCPNDTFAFHAIMEEKINFGGLDLEIQLLDIQQLNEGLEDGVFDFAKASFATALRLAERYGVLRSGAALGFGVGPLLLADHQRDFPTQDDLIYTPGKGTTAAMLMRCLHPDCNNVEHRVFSDIMPALASGAAKYGVVIHEGRFTYQEHGLHLIEDLGATWEAATGGPLPLGGILARLDLPEGTASRFNVLLKRSIDYAWANKGEAFGTMQKHAQELDPRVIWSHVDLYVNEWTRDLGDVGERALAELARRAKDAGLIVDGSPELRLLGSWNSLDV